MPEGGTEGDVRAHAEGERRGTRLHRPHEAQLLLPPERGGPSVYHPDFLLNPHHTEAATTRMGGVERHQRAVGTDTGVQVALPVMVDIGIHKLFQTLHIG